MSTYQYPFISRYARLSSILEMAGHLAQQAQREAFSDEEVSRSRSRVEQVAGFQQRLDEIWRGMRWTMDIISYARDKTIQGGLPLGVLYAPPASPSDSPTLDSRKDMDKVSSGSSDPGYHSDRSNCLDNNNEAVVRGESLEDSSEDTAVWRGAMSGILRVYSAYRNRSGSVKLQVTPRTTSREVLHLVLQQLNRAAVAQGDMQPPLEDEDFCLVAVIGARERVLRPDFQPLQLQNPWAQGRLYVRLKNDVLAALDQVYTTSVWKNGETFLKLTTC